MYYCCKRTESIRHCCTVFEVDILYSYFYVCYCYKLHLARILNFFLSEFIRTNILEIIGSILFTAAFLNGSPVLVPSMFLLLYLLLGTLFSSRASLALSNQYQKLTARRLMRVTMKFTPTKLSWCHHNRIPIPAPLTT